MESVRRQPIEHKETPIPHACKQKWPTWLLPFDWRPLRYFLRYCNSFWILFRVLVKLHNSFHSSLQHQLQARHICCLWHCILKTSICCGRVRNRCSTFNLGDGTRQKKAKHNTSQKKIVSSTHHRTLLQVLLREYVSLTLAHLHTTSRQNVIKMSKSY